jgi:acetate kinase
MLVQTNRSRLCVQEITLIYRSYLVGKSSPDKEARSVKILVLMVGFYWGSTSVKFDLFDMKDESLVARGVVEKIGQSDSLLSFQKKDDSLSRRVVVHNCVGGIRLAFQTLMDPEDGVLKDSSELSGIGHRVVHGGERFLEHCIIDDKVIDDIRECIPLAPLHNPYNLIGIETSRQLLPDVKHVAVFDTSFHRTIPEKAYIYALPYDLYVKYKVRRYGFHGPSHSFVAERAAALLGKPLESLKIITCHLGNGASVAAIDHGRSVDTSMGFTPLEGLVMGTRSGDIDPAILLFLMEKEGYFQRDIDNLLNKRSGLLGISAISSSMVELMKAMEDGSSRAALAIEVFCYRLKKYISAYIGILGGADAIVFSAGIGENNSFIRARALDTLSFFGILLDENKNSLARGETEISSPGSAVKVLVIPTNEELMIARETRRLL